MRKNTFPQPSSQFSDKHVVKQHQQHMSPWPSQRLNINHVLSRSLLSKTSLHKNMSVRESTNTQKHSSFKLSLHVVVDNKILWTHVIRLHFNSPPFSRQTLYELCGFMLWKLIMVRLFGVCFGISGFFRAIRFSIWWSVFNNFLKLFLRLV